MMLLLSNSAEQTVAPGQAIVFDRVLLHTGYSEGCGIRDRVLATVQAGLRNAGLYAISFNGNIAGTAPTQLNIEFDGATLPETTIISNSADAQNISTQTVMRTCGNSNVRVINTGANEITLSPNSLLSIGRRA